MPFIFIRGARGLARLGLFAIIPVLLAAAPPSRIQGPIHNNRVVQLRGHIHREARPESDRGELPDANRLENLILTLKPSPEQTAELEAFLEQQRDSASSEYQHWLTPEEFGDRFGASPSDIATISSWLQAQGFEPGTVARARNWISVSGTAGQAALAFRTAFHRFAASGEIHFANITEPSIPEALAGIVEGIRGLDDFRPHPQRSLPLKPNFTASSGAHYLVPDDLAAIYNIQPLYAAGYDGTGQKIVIPGQTNINLADIRAFRARFSLPARDPQIVLFGADPGIRAEDQIEADLDLEWSGAVARNATIIYVNSRNVFSSIQYAVDQNLAPVISLSYGGCETINPASFRSVARQANAQGITWLNASGDSGAAGCDFNTVLAKAGPSVVFPASFPEITAVGGTEFTETGGAGWNTQNTATWASATGWITEKAWNDTAPGKTISSTGGGASQVYGKPWWQAGSGVPDDKARDIPDVSLSASSAHDGYLIVAGGQLLAIGGTSASSPAFAGIVSLLNHYLLSKGSVSQAGLGNINPALYSLAQQTNDIFHDTTDGDNIVPCEPGSNGCVNGSFGYRAGPGYDLVTGLGSVDAWNLITKWTSQRPGAGTTLTLVASPATITPATTTQLTATVTAVTGSALPAGTITFAAGNLALGSAPVVIAGSKATATLAVKGNALAEGSNMIFAAYVATGNFSNSSASVTVAVVAPVIEPAITLTATPASIAPSATTQLIATVKPARAGSVSFTAGGTTIGTAPLIGSIATLTLAGSKLASGPNTITAGFAGSSAVAIISVVSALPATATTAIASPASISQSASTTLTVTVKTAAGGAKPLGTVIFFLGKTTLASASLNTTGTAAVIVKGEVLPRGSNSITVNYAGNAAFAPSSATVLVTVTAPSVATTTTATASPASFSQSSTTQLVATVKAASGSTAPVGIVSFLSGNIPLGAVALRGSGSISTATLTVKGTRLALGSNAITASYLGTGNFSSSSASLSLTVTRALIATTATLVASAPALAASGTVQLTFSVKSTTGTTIPAGSVTFLAGQTELGTVNLANPTAVLSVPGSRLTPGVNTIRATFTPSGNFSGATASTSVTVITGAGSSRVAALNPGK